ncbi:hypothetical protein SmJEL517_g00776 [Synchytrium microbalum]|uniref:3-oxoacyl-[acyl-carrier-protein] reductase n=1 Tax=Synchytrium microbalum TaxID=1806994 RepID=A0A507CIT0_9FUNG|nr:uncharacterized protein SmJEL517_g00776 [Synchytrium microbalum]TPX37655.1 hypothetical protein SmJEL517_g00776 [Synchytrium microbalum]
MAIEKSVAIIGASSGLGLALAKHFASKGTRVYGTTRDGKDIQVEGVFTSKLDTSEKRSIDELKIPEIQELYVVAGYFSKESFDEMSWEEELKMYKTGAMGPLFVTRHLVKQGSLRHGSKVIWITSEAGSIGLRTEKEGGGLYGHHASKTAQNMNGKLLSFDLKPKGISIVMIHPGFMKTGLTKSVGFDKHYEKGGAIDPEEAVEPLLKVVANLTLENTGKFIAPVGPKGVGNAHVLGPVEKLPAPLELPW